MDALTKKISAFPFVAEYAHACTEGFALAGELASLAEFLGYSIEEIKDKKLTDIISPDVLDERMKKLTQQIDDGKIELFLPLVKKNGSVVWVVDRGAVSEGKVKGIFLETENVRQLFAGYTRELEEYRRKLSKSETMVSSLTVRADMDSLTNLFNAGATRKLVEDYLADGDKNCAVIVIDVDDFKHINDRFGHMVGDLVMSCAAYTIKKLFRSGDIVGRVGGDEFLVLMKDISDRKIAEMRCAQIVNAFQNIECEKIDGQKLSCSVGAAISPAHGSSYNALFCRADEAMYRAKRSGGNGYILEE